MESHFHIQEVGISHTPCAFQVSFFGVSAASATCCCSSKGMDPSPGGFGPKYLDHPSPCVCRRTRRAVETRGCTMFEVLIRESPCTVAMHVLFRECPGTVDRPFTAVRAARPTAAASVTSPPCGAPLPPTCAPGHPAALRRRRRREREVLSALTGRVQGGRTRKTGKGRRPFFKK